jgi:phenylpyruvate tautomerase PptA (4-oxalocrotonate tautomerase family)
MPLVQVKLYEHELTGDVVNRLISGITDAVCAATREDLRPAVWVLVEGVPAPSWGAGGKPGMEAP